MVCGREDLGLTGLELRVIVVGFVGPQFLRLVVPVPVAVPIPIPVPVPTGFWVLGAGLVPVASERHEHQGQDVASQGA